MKKCEYCGRDNPDHARHCHECGSELEMEGASTKEAKRGSGEEKMRRGSVWMAGGVVVAVLTYKAADIAPGDGTYVVAWGLLVFGSLEFIKGLTMTKSPCTQNEAHLEDLAVAAKLQSAGQLHAALPSSSSSSSSKNLDITEHEDQEEEEPAAQLVQTRSQPTDEKTAVPCGTAGLKNR